MDPIPNMKALSELLIAMRMEGYCLCLTDGQMWEAQFVKFGDPAMTEGFVWKACSMERAIQGAAEMLRGKTPDPEGEDGSLNGGDGSRRSMEDPPAPPLLPEG